MATMANVVACWRVIEAAGIPRPWTTEEQTDQAVRVWAAVLADVPDERLQTLTVAWLRSPEARFRQWPMPGALLHALPDPATVDDADDAWGEVMRMVRSRGVEWCAGLCTVPELERRRELYREAYRAAAQAEDHAKLARALANGSLLPRQDDHRSAALLAGVAACGGWRALGRADEDALVSHRASFRSIYRGYRQRRQLSATEAAVVALLDSSNRPRLTGRS